MKIIFALLGTFFLTVFPLVTSSSIAGEKQGVLRVRIPAEPDTLDWNMAFDTVPVLGNLMEGLLKISPELVPSPSLAQSWELGSDQKTYLFHLKPGVLWQDGVPLKAQQFVDSWERLLSPVTGSRYANILMDVEGAEDFNSGKINNFNLVGVKALDDLTLEVKLKEPNANWLWVLTHNPTFPIRKDLIELYGKSWTDAGNLVTLGPFGLKGHESGKIITLTKNPLYHGMSGNLNQIDYIIISDDQAAIDAYLEGRIDLVTRVSLVESRRLQERSDFRTNEKLATTYLRFNIGHWPSLAGPQVRRALLMAIDRSELRNILGGNVRFAKSFVPPSLLGNSESSVLPFDPELAREEITNSGVDFVNHPIKLVVWKESKIDVAIGLMIQSQLMKNLGIQIELQDWDPKDKNYSLGIGEWEADFPDPSNFYSLFINLKGIPHEWRDMDFHQLVESAKTAIDPLEKQQLYWEAEKLLVSEDCMLMPLYYPAYGTLIREEFHGFHPAPFGQDNLKDMYISN